MKYMLPLALFMLLAGPRIKFPDLNLLFAFILALLAPIVCYKQKFITKNIYILFTLLSAFFIYSLINTLLNDAIDFASIEEAIRNFIWFFAALSIVFLYRFHYKESGFLVPLSRHILFSFLINCIFVVLVMFVPFVREFATSYLSINEKMGAIINSSVRATDLVMGGGSISSVVFSVFFFYSLCIYKFTKIKLAIFCMFFAILGIIFTGRSGLIFVLFSYMPVACLINFYLVGKFNFLLTVKNFIISIFLIAGAGVGGFLLASLILPEITLLIFDNSLSWSFEMFINLYESGQASTNSTSSLMDMYGRVGFSDVFSLFGSSLSGRDRDVYYLQTDVGYLRILFTSGVIGLLLVISKYFYLSIYAIQNVFNRSVGPFEMAMIIALAYYIFAIFVVNFKEYHEGIRAGFPLLMIFAVVLLSRKNISNHY